MMMEEKKIVISIGEVLYISFFSLMLAAKGIGLYDGQALYKILFLTAMILAVAKICMTKYSVGEWIMLIGIGAITGAVYLVSREKGVLLCTAVVLAVKNVSVKKIFKVGAWVWGITMSENILYHLIFLENSGYKVHEKLGLGHIFRWDLGFSHPNVLHIAYLTMAAFIVYNLGKKYDWKAMLGLMAGNFLIFLYSVSYTGILVVTLYLGMAWYVSIRKKLGRVEYGLLELVFPVCLFLSFLSPFLLPEKLFNIVNQIFSTRLSLAKYFLVEENMKLFGNNLAEITTYQLTMDNSYVFAFIIYGIVFFSLIIIGYLGTVHMQVRNKETGSLVMIAAFLIAGISEPFLFNTSFKNITLVFVGEFLFSCFQKKDRSRREWGIYPLGDRKITLGNRNSSIWIKAFSELWNLKKSRILTFSVIVGIMVGMFVGISCKMPEGYIVPRSQADMESEETYYLESREDVRYTGYQIMDYQNPETKMQVFDGTIVQVERFRRGVSAACAAAVITGGLYAAGAWIRSGRRKAAINEGFNGK